MKQWIFFCQNACEAFCVLLGGYWEYFSGDLRRIAEFSEIWQNFVEFCGVLQSVIEFCGL